jgi:hypothetical protein
VGDRRGGKNRLSTSATSLGGSPHDRQWHNEPALKAVLAAERWKFGFTPDKVVAAREQLEKAR